MTKSFLNFESAQGAKYREYGIYVLALLWRDLSSVAWTWSNTLALFHQVISYPKPLPYITTLSLYYCTLNRVFFQTTFEFRWNERVQKMWSLSSFYPQTREKTSLWRISDNRCAFLSCFSCHVPSSCCHVTGHSKKSVSWSRPRRGVRFFAWCSAYLK